jgi:hypothetical protein
VSTLTNIVIILCVIYAVVVLIVYSLFRAVGLSGGKAFLVTMAFMLFGLWHPPGWIMLGFCLLAQYAQHREQITATKQPEVAAAPASASVVYPQLTKRGEHVGTN